ncbi:DUF1707 SHOCT-like domain-containing protein [Blastococcus sp. SYSU D00813]
MDAEGTAGAGQQGVRASDAERQAVVDRLTAAGAEGRLDPDELRTRSEAAYAAVTVGELAALTADLPRAGDLPVPAAAAPAPRPGPAGGSGSGPVVAVFGGTERRGRWRPATRQRATAVFGGVVLDYREADLPPGPLHVRATAVFGGVDLVLPEGATVELTGFSLFGGRDVKARGGSGPAGGPAVHVRAVAVFGGVTVRTAATGG